MGLQTSQLFQLYIHKLPSEHVIQLIDKINSEPSYRGICICRLCVAKGSLGVQPLRHRACYSHRSKFVSERVRAAIGAAHIGCSPVLDRAEALKLLALYTGSTTSASLEGGGSHIPSIQPHSAAAVAAVRVSSDEEGEQQWHYDDGNDLGGDINGSCGSQPLSQCPRYSDDQLALRAISEMESRLDVADDVLESRVMGKDGSIQEKLTEVDIQADGEVKKGIQSWLDLFAGFALKAGIPLKSTTEFLRDCSNSKGIFAPGLTDGMPTDAKSMYETTVACHAPTIHKYQQCQNPHCGELRRCELRDSEECKCGRRWENQWVRMFSILDILVLIFLSPPLAAAMASRGKKRLREDECEEGDRRLLDVEDTKFFLKKLANDPLFRNESRHALIAFFLDGMLRVKSDSNSGTVKVGVIKFLNFPAWIRQMLGCSLPIFLLPPNSKVKNVQPILNAHADTIAYLKKKGHRVWDAHRNEHFQLHADLIKVSSDSRGTTQATGRAEPPSKDGASLGGDYKGVTLTDKLSGETTAHGRPKRIPGKVAYTEGWLHLPPSSTNERVKRMRVAAASLNPPREVCPDDDTAADAWPVDKEAPIRWTDADIRCGMACLALAEAAEEAKRIGIDVGVSDADIKHLKALADAVGVKQVSPWLKTGVDMGGDDGGETYDPMHAIANCMKKLLYMQLAHKGVFKSSNKAEHFVYESEVNDRFVQLGTAFRQNRRLTATQISDMAEYPLRKDEKALGSKRGAMVIDNNLAHAAIKGAKVFHAYREYGIVDSKGPQHLKCSDLDKLCGPVAKWFTSGLCAREFTVGEVSHTYEYVYCEFVDALNEVGRKGITLTEADQALAKMVEAVTLFYLAFPTYEQDHILHQAVEIARNAPAWVHSVADGERMMRTVRKRDLNPRDLSTTVMLSLQRHMGKFIKEMTEVEDLKADVDGVVSKVVNEGVVLQESRDETGIQLELVTPNIALYFKGVGSTDIVMKGNKRKRLNPGGVDSEQHRTMASLIDYYLNNNDWHAEYAPLLHSLMDQFVDDGGARPGIKGRRGSNLQDTSGVTGIINAWKMFISWLQQDHTCRNEPWWQTRSTRTLPEAAEKLYLSKYMYIAERCSIDGVDFRSQRCDNHKHTLTVGSYFLAKIKDGEGEYYDVGRVSRFFKHRCPGTDDASEQFEDYMYFVEAKWLTGTLPRRTETTKLPMVLYDNKPDRYLSDNDDSSGFMTSIWPVAMIEPEEVCLLPLDEAHDIPVGTKLCSASISSSVLATHYPMCRPSTGRGNSRNATTNVVIGDVDPTKGVKDGYKLAAVITKYCKTLEKLEIM